MPREHGAWGILLIPFATAVGISGAFDLKVALLLASVLCFYIARTSYLKHNVRWTGWLLATSFACVFPLLFFWKLWWLVVFGAIAAPLAFRKTERGVASQLLAVCGLTLTAPAAWYAATGKLDYRLWLFNVLYFAGGVFYVKMHIAAAMARRATAPHPDPLPAGGERGPVIGFLLPLGGEGQDEGVGRQPQTLPARSRWRLGAATMIYYGALAVVAALWWPVGLAFGPAIVRAFVGVARLSPALRIKRLGWTEVAYSLVFAALLIATVR